VCPGRTRATLTGQPGATQAPARVNLILLDPAELSADGTAQLTGRRAAHAAEVLRAAAGARLRVGVLGGRIGSGEVVSSARDELVLRVSLEEDPPPRAPVDLLLALPRPKILRKVLRAVASMGVARVALVGSYRVEKSYFGSPLLAPDAIAAELRLGLEQGRDTVGPSVEVHRYFKPFVEDVLDGVFGDARRLLAQPGAASPPLGLAPLDPEPTTPARAVVAIGPEGGWTPFEAEELARRGFTPFSLGPRVLRVDTAVPYALGQVELWLRGQHA
jgi:16S rRNA (uracil1498-N3)-methyltransferase